MRGALKRRSTARGRAGSVAVQQAAAMVHRNWLARKAGADATIPLVAGRLAVVYSSVSRACGVHSSDLANGFGRRALRRAHGVWRVRDRASSPAAYRQCVCARHCDLRASLLESHCRVVKRFRQPHAGQGAEPG
jgi:hypothetical protein